MEDRFRKETNNNYKLIDSPYIISIVQYMFMHQLYRYMCSYPNMWDYVNHKKISEWLGIGQNKTDSLFIFHMNAMQSNREELDQINEKLKAYEMEKQILENTIKNTQREYYDLKKSNEDTGDPCIDEMEQLLFEYRSRVHDIDQCIENLKKNQIKYADKSNKDNRFQPSNCTDNKIATYYDMIYKNKYKGSDADNCMKQYIDIWKQLIDSMNVVNDANDSINTLNESDNIFDANDSINTLNESDNSINAPNNQKPEEINGTTYRDPVQTIDILQKQIVRNGTVAPKTLLDTYGPIFCLYSTVLDKYGHDFIELPAFLEKPGNIGYNYGLTQIFDIMQHVFKHVISFNFVRTVKNHIENMEEDKLDINSLNERLKKFTDYCYRTLPRQIIKKICNISHETDDDELKKTVEDILDEAMSMIDINITTIKPDIISIFSVYMEIYTKQMYDMMIKQLKLFIIHNTWFEILSHLATKIIDT